MTTCLLTVMFSIQSDSLVPQPHQSDLWERAFRVGRAERFVGVGVMGVLP